MSPVYVNIVKPVHKGMIVIVFGLPGTGKSYFASRLAEKICAEYISSDGIRFKIIHDRRYTEQEKMKVYTQMLLLTRELIGQKKAVVLDGTFYKKEIRQMFLTLAADLNVNIVFIEITARKSLAMSRVSRKRKDSEAGLEVYQKIKRLFERFDDKHLKLESKENNIEKMLEEAIGYLG